MTWSRSLPHESWYSLASSAVLAGWSLGLISRPDPSPPQEACSRAAAVPPGQSVYQEILPAGCACCDMPRLRLQFFNRFSILLCDFITATADLQAESRSKKTPLQITVFGPLMDPASQGPQEINIEVWETRRTLEGRKGTGTWQCLRRVNFSCSLRCRELCQ